MAAVDHIVRPTSAKTFADYATQHIVPFLEYQIIPTIERINALWDNYPEDNLKSLTHQRRVQVHELGLGMATLKSRSTNGTVHCFKTRETKMSYYLSSVKRLSRKILVGNSFYVPNVREFFRTDHVMCLLSNHATTLKQIQGYFFILRMHQDRNTMQHMFEQLIAILWSLPYASSQHLVC